MIPRVLIDVGLAIAPMTMGYPRLFYSEMVKEDDDSPLWFKAIALLVALWFGLPLGIIQDIILWSFWVFLAPFNFVEWIKKQRAGG